VKITKQADAATPAGVTSGQEGTGGALWSWCDWTCETLRDGFGRKGPGEAWAARLQSRSASSTSLTLNDLPLFELALRLKLLRSVPGRAKALRELSKGDSTPARFNHTALQLEVAALGLAVGWRPRLEVLRRRAPVDVVLATDEGLQLEVEVCVVPVGDRTAEAMARNRDLISLETQLYAIGHEVSITGRLRREPTAEEVEFVPGELRAAIDLVASDRRARRVRVGDAGFLTVSYGAGDEGLQTSWDFDPRLDPRRLLSTIEEKVEQASRSGARWLWLDWRDAHWQLGPWWDQPLAVKAVKVKQLVARAVRSESAFDGVIVTPGLLIVSNGHADETARVVDGTLALRKSLPMARVREAVVVPLTVDGRSELKTVVRLFEIEPEWLPWALKQLGLRELSAIVST
jgi:hypothetical protein